MERLQDKDWLQAKVENTPLHHIAKELNVPYSRVQTAVKKLGVVLPTRKKYVYTEESRQRKSENIKLALQKSYPDGRYGENSSNWRGGKPTCQEEGCTTILSRMDATYCKRHRIAGERSPGWRGGVQTFNSKIRGIPEYFAWRSAVFERDGYMCIVGGKAHGNQLEADHIIAFAEIMEKFSIDTLDAALACSLLWDISNGRTLCKNCHGLTKNYGRRRKQNKQGASNSSLFVIHYHYYG